MYKVNKTLSRSNIPRTIRFTEEIFDKLAEISSSEKISFNALVLQCCRYALCNYEKNGEFDEAKGISNE